MSLAPVVLFVYNRPDHTYEVLCALERNDLAFESQLFIYADGPRPNAGQEEIERIKLVRKLIRTRRWCGSVNIVESKINLGLANSIVGGITTVVSDFEKIIVLEDDIVTAKGFLTFMNRALDIYENESKVMDVSGFAFPVNRAILPETFFLQMASSWGWATWKRAWDHFNSDTSKLYEELKSTGKWEKFLSIGHTNFETQLLSNLTGKMNTWAIKWQATMTLRDGLSLQPGRSLVRNIGFDSTGTNYTSADNIFSNPDLIENLEIHKIPENEIEENREIAKLYGGFYGDKSQERDAEFKKKLSFFDRFVKSFRF